MAWDNDAVNGIGPLLYWFGIWTFVWLGLLYFASRTYRIWARCYPPSTKLHENCKYYNGRMIVGILHAAVVSLCTVPTMFILMGKPDDQFMFTDDLAWCSVDYHVSEEQAKLRVWVQVVALAGLMFTAFMFADLIFMSVHGFMTPDYLVHHIAFIAAGMVIRTNCVLPYNAAILLSMEVSTPFLNYMLFVRHRGDRFGMSSNICGVLFFFTFVVFRVVFNLYGAVYLVIQRQVWMSQVPTWQAWFLVVAVAAGAAVQLFWFPKILQMFHAGIVTLLSAPVDDSAIKLGVESKSEPCIRLDTNV